MEIARKTIGKVTVSVIADKKSTYYLNESRDIKKVDECFLMHQIALLKNAKKAGSFIIKLTAISERQKQNLIGNDLNFVKKNYKKVQSGGIFTMLKNKGII